MPYIKSNRNTLHKTKKIAIFASGSGSNFKSIHRHVQSGEIPARIILAVSNNPDSGAIEYAKGNNISTLIINKICYPNSIVREKLLILSLKENDVSKNFQQGIICRGIARRRFQKKFVINDFFDPGCSIRRAGSCDCYWGNRALEREV